MRRLTGLDAAFLALETESSTGHVGGLSILDPSTAPTPPSFETISAILGSRIAAVPVLRQRLMTVPMGLDQPVWVDDAHFDLGYHLRELGLPSPGSDSQLAEQVARIHARPLDRSRPLWETYVITGLSGDRMAIYTKVHHAAVDGVSGAEMLTLLFDLTPDVSIPSGEASTFRPRPAPNRNLLGARALARLAWRPVEVARLAANGLRSIPAVAPALGPVVAGLVGLGREGSGDGDVVRSATPLVAPPTPLNVSISPHRRFAFASLSLDDVKFVKNTFGVSVNDVVMAMAAGALRRWLLTHDALPDGPLVSMVPVSIRTSGTEVGGNKVSAMLASLPTHLEDPLERLAVTRQATTVAKAQQAFIPQGLVDEVSDFAPPALVGRATRVVFASKVLHRLPAFNTVISNVPGPNVPVYLAGAQLLAHHPVSVVTDGIGLNITVIGYLGRLHFGLVAAREVVPDLDDLMAWFGEELDTLVVAARAAIVAQAEPTVAPVKPPAQKDSARKAPAQKTATKKTATRTAATKKTTAKKATPTKGAARKPKP